jgi:periplasmic protein TonB
MPERYDAVGKSRKAGVAVVVGLLHVVVVILLVRAFTPDFAARIAQDVGRALTVTVTTPPPTPTPSPKPSPSNAAPEPEAQAAPPGRRAEPKEVAAPEAKVVLAQPKAPPVAAKGNADDAGAAAQGSGTGAGGEGDGTGAGRYGNGTGGGGVAAKAVKIAGSIDSARDYPRASRDRRIGSDVVIALTVGTDGRVEDCRIVRPSPDPEADRITCRLASDRFRFRPAMDAAGQPMQSTFGWRQRWFTAGQN